MTPLPGQFCRFVNLCNMPKIIIIYLINLSLLHTQESKMNATPASVESVQKHVNFQIERFLKKVNLLHSPLLWRCIGCLFGKHIHERRREPSELLANMQSFFSTLATRPTRPNDILFNVLFPLSRARYRMPHGFRHLKATFHSPGKISVRIKI